MDIKEKIDSLRKEKGWTKCRLAKELGISPASVFNWYNKWNYSPSRETLDNICDVFGVSITEFYTDIQVEGLTKKEIQVLELFRSLPQAKQDNAIAILKMLKE